MEQVTPKNIKKVLPLLPFAYKQLTIRPLAQTDYKPINVNKSMNVIIPFLCFQILAEVLIFAAMKPVKKGTKSKRTKHLHFSLNEEEYALICKYVKKYKIANRARWCRETLVTHILKNLEKDHPTLFEENEMRR